MRFTTITAAALALCASAALRTSPVWVAILVAASFSSSPARSWWSC